MVNGWGQEQTVSHTSVSEGVTEYTVQGWPMRTHSQRFLHNHSQMRGKGLTAGKVVSDKPDRSARKTIVTVKAIVA